MDKQTARIIMVYSCEQCPNLSVEEEDKNEYTFCWSIMKVIKDINSIDKECQLEEVDIELEDVGELDD